MNLTAEEERLLRDAVLEKYAATDLNTFQQFDGWSDSWGDSFIHADQDGDGVTCSKTKELMAGRSAVRVLIKEPCGDRLAACRLLRKIADSIESGLWCDPGQPRLRLVDAIQQYEPF